MEDFLIDFAMPVGVILGGWFGVLVWFVCF